jgi:hypothetical protein
MHEKVDERLSVKFCPLDFGTAVISVNFEIAIF